MVYSLLRVVAVSFPCPTIVLLLSFAIPIGWNGTAVAVYHICSTPVSSGKLVCCISLVHFMQA